MAHTEILKPRTLHISLKEKVLLNLLCLAVTYQISLTKLQCSKQKLDLMCNINHAKYPCRICAKNVHDKDKAVQCDLCELWIHIKCNNLNYLDYRYLQNCDESWYCIECCSTIFPFNSLSSNKNFLACCANTDNNITQ